MKITPGRVSRQSFSKVLGGRLKSGLSFKPTGRIGQTLRKAGMGGLLHKQSYNRGEMKRVVGALEEGGYLKNTGQRANQTIDRTFKTEKEAYQASLPKGPTIQEKANVNRLKNEAAQALLERKNMNKDLDLRKFRQSIHSDTDRKVAESKKVNKSEKKISYNRPTMAPAGFNASRFERRPSRTRSASSAAETFERNVGTLEHGLAKPEDEKVVISIGDQVILTGEKIAALKKDGNMDAYPSETGIVNDIYEDGYSVDFGGSIKRVLKTDVVLKNEIDDPLKAKKETPDDQSVTATEDNLRGNQLKDTAKENKASNDQSTETTEDDKPSADQPDEMMI